MSCVFTAATCQVQAPRDLQAGCELMKLGTPATLHDCVEKHACVYRHSLAMACHHGLFPVPALQAGHSCWAQTCVGCLAFMHLGPAIMTMSRTMSRLANFS